VPEGRYRICADAARATAVRRHVVASTDDRYESLERARTFGEAWGSRLMVIGAAGHINSASGLGDWPAGLEMLVELAGRGSVIDRDEGRLGGEDTVTGPCWDDVGPLLVDVQHDLRRAARCTP
jgi:hypothetical protein